MHCAHSVCKLRTASNEQRIYAIRAYDGSIYSQNWVVLYFRIVQNIENDQMYENVKKKKEKKEQIEKRNCGNGKNNR